MSTGAGAAVAVVAAAGVQGTAGRDGRGTPTAAGGGITERGTAVDGGDTPRVPPGKVARSAARGSSSGIGRGRRRSDFIDAGLRRINHQFRSQSIYPVS